MEACNLSEESKCGLTFWAEEWRLNAKGFSARFTKRHTSGKSNTHKSVAASPKEATSMSASTGYVSGPIPQSLKQRSLMRISHALRCALRVSDAASASVASPKIALPCHLEEDDELSTEASTSSPMSGKVSLMLTSCSSICEAASAEVTSPCLAPIFSENGAAYTRWETALAGRQVADLTRQELEALAHSEMPHKYRLFLWPQWLTGATRVETSELEPPFAVAAAIELDIPRTAPGALHVRGRASIRRMLHAYANLRPDVGYCQGLNYVASIFVILGFDEATARDGFISLVERCCPGYHGQGLEGFSRDALVLGALARTRLPAELGHRLEQLDVPLAALAVDHFLTLASVSWPLMATARLWDLLILHGQPALFASFLALLQLYFPETIAEDCDPGHAFRMSVIVGVTEDLDTVLKLTCDLLKTIDQRIIDHYRFTFSGIRM